MMRILRFTALVLTLLWFVRVPMSAQLLDEPPNVYLDVSTDARNKLRTLDSYLRQEEWSEAVGLLQSLIEDNANKLVPTARDSSTNFVNLRTYCQFRLSQLPEEALRIYRQRVDSQAKDLLQRYQATGDLANLERIVDEHFCSSVAPEAIERLADRATSDGQFSRARAYWKQILPPELVKRKNHAEEVVLIHPSPEIDQARVLAKYLITEILDGRPEDGEAALAYLKEHFPDAAGTLAGRDGKYWEIVAAAAQDSALTKPAVENSNWSTFAGNAERTKIAPSPIDVGDVQWKWTFDEENQPDVDGRNANGEEDLLAYHPVIVGDIALLATDRYLYTFHLESGEMQQWYDFQGDAPAGRGAGDARSRFTLTVAGDRLFVRTGTSGFNTSRLGRPPRHPFGATSVLYCFDYKKQKLLWNKPSGSIATNGDLFYEGAPVVTDDVVYIAATRIDAMSQTSVLALAAQTGELLWRTLVCEATNEQADFGLTHNLLTLADGTIYYCTNLGAIAALSAHSGQLQWVTVYPRGKPMLSRHVTSMTPDLNPSVFHHGKLFVAPKDTSKILCLNAQTGQKLWEANPPVAHLLGVAKGNLIVTGNRVWGIDTETGKIRWYWPENTVSSHGRGILAGDLVYWPTRERIHVLEQETGRVARPPIELYSRLRLKGGNMVLGDGYLLLAQSKNLLAMVPYSRLIRKLEQELVEHPNSAELHMRLAEAATAIDDFKLAKSHMVLAGQTAQPGELYDGRGLAELAKERLYQAVLREADSFAAAANVDAAIVSLREAETHAPSPAARLEAIVRQAKTWLASGEAGKAAAAYQQVLEDPSLEEQFVAVQPEPKSPAAINLPARQWARTEIDRLIDQHGRAIYAAFDAKVARSLIEERAGDALVAMSEQYPNAERHGELLFAAAKAYQKEGRARDARLLYRKLVSTSPQPAPLLVPSLLALDDIYQQQGLSPLRPLVLERLTREFGTERMPDNPAQTVADYVRTELAALKAKSLPNERFSGLRRLIALPRTEDRYQIPVGPALVDGGRETVYRCGPSALVALSAIDARELWSAEMGSRPIWLANGISGLVVGMADRLCCLGYASGNTIWEVAWSPENDDARWTPAVAPADRALMSAAQFALVGEIVLWVDPDHCLRGIDSDAGKVLWKVTVADAAFLPVLRPAGPVACAWTAERVYGVDPHTGRTVFEVKRHHNLSPSPLVQAGGGLVVATDRATIAGIQPSPEDDAAIRWSQTFVWPSFASPELHGDGNRVLAVIDGYQLAAMDPSTGKNLWHLPLGTRPSVPMAPDGMAVPGVLHGGHFVYVFGTWMECRSAADGQMQWRAPLPEPGTLLQLWAHENMTVVLAAEKDRAALSVWETKTGREAQRLNLNDLGPGVCLQWGEDFAIAGGERATWILARDRSVPATGGLNE